MKKRQNYKHGPKTQESIQTGPRMTTFPSQQLRSYDFSHLCVGDLVEVRQNQKVHHRGHIEEAHPTSGVFWISDTITGTRKLIDFDSFEIFYERQQEAEPVPA